MPNHIHGIISIVRGAGENPQSAVTYRKKAMRGLTDPPIWQRNYYDHIIRNDMDYEAIWNYIETNPTKWIDDRLNPYQRRCE